MNVSVLSDPQIFALDESSPMTRFDGEGGSLLLGAGWAPSEFTKDGGVDKAFAWATGGEAELIFLSPRERSADLYARCFPFSYPGAPRQAIDLLLDGRPAGHAEVTEGIQNLRTPILGELAPGRLHRLLLRFSYATRPADVIQSADARPLSAAFLEAAVIPRRTGASVSESLLARFDRESRVLTLSDGTSAALPLPADSAATLRLGAVEGRCRDCAVSIELVRPGGGRSSLLESSPARLSGKTIRFETGVEPGARLSIAMRSGSEPVAAGLDSSIRIAFPVNFLGVRRAKRANPAAPNIFVYLIDTLRADSLEPYGSSRPTSPAIARFSKDAVVYRKAWAASTWTLPSVVSILTGVYPSHHGVVRGTLRYSDAELPPLSRRLAARGYDTVGISQSFLASGAFGTAAGFGTFLFTNKLDGRELRSQEIRAYLAEWLASREAPGKPIFCYVHTVDPHAPYSPKGRFARFAQENPGALGEAAYVPENFMTGPQSGDPRERAHLKGLYDGEVLYADEQFGLFVEELKLCGLYDDATIILVSDHGEEFGEHGGFDHGRTVYEELVDVPLIVKYPRGRNAGQRIDRRVNLVDLAPTILRLAGLPADSGFDGEPLPETAVPTGDSQPRIVLSEVNPSEGDKLASVDYKAVAIGRLKCIESLNGIDQFAKAIPRWQVFDLADDSGEKSPLPGSDPRVRECRSRMESWRAALDSRVHDRVSAARPASNDAVQKLRALGYLR